LILTSGTYQAKASKFAREAGGFLRYKLQNVSKYAHLRYNVQGQWGLFFSFKKGKRVHYTTSEPTSWKESDYVIKKQVTTIWETMGKRKSLPTISLGKKKRDTFQA